MGLIGTILLSFTIHRNIFGLCEVSFSSERISCFLIKPFGKTEIVLPNPLVLAKAFYPVVLKAKEQKKHNGLKIVF